MPKLWMVICFFFCSFPGWLAYADGGGEVCTFVPDQKKNKLRKEFLSFFEREVGVRMRKVILIEVKECDGRYYASVEGVTQSGVRRLWFIEIFKGPNGRKVLHRPE